MARFEYGAGSADYLVAPSDGQWAVGQGVSCTFWSAQVDGAQYTNLLNAGLEPITSVVSDEYGALPRFWGPDGVVSMWADAGGGRRVYLDAHNAGGTQGPPGVIQSINGVSEANIELDAASVGALPVTGGALQGEVTTNLTGRAAYLKVTSDEDHAVTIYQASTTGVDVAAALNVASDNRESSAMYVRGHELARGTLKIAHLNGGTAVDADASAAAISVDLQYGDQTGTAAQGLFITATTGPTTGNLITARNNGRDDFVVKGNGAVGIRVPTGHVPAGALEVAQGDNTTVGLALAPYSSTAADVLQMKDSGGNLRFQISAGGNTVLRAVAFLTASVQLGATSADIGGATGAVISMKNATTAPSTNPTSGAIVYVQGGYLKARAADGTIFDTTKRTVTGSRASGAALTSLLAALVSTGLITDTTTA